MVDEQPAAPRIDRRRARTRAALLQAGQALFARRPVDGVSIDDIVLAADVAKGSFYNHFDDKEALAREIAAQVRGATEQVVTEINVGVDDAARRVARALCVFVRDAGDNPERNRALQRLFAGATQIEAPMNRGVREDVQAGLSTGRFAGVSLETGVLLIMGVVQVAVARALESPASSPAVCQDVTFALLRGLGVAPADAAEIAAAARADIFAAQPSAAA